MVKIKCIHERSTILALSGPKGTTFFVSTLGVTSWWQHLELQ